MNVKDHIRGMSLFTHYSNGELWYKTMDTDFVFPVPIKDLGNTRIEVSERSMLLMRYIRKFIESFK